MASSDEAPVVESSSAAEHNEGETLTEESKSVEVDETLAAMEVETLTKESTSVEVDETLASEKGKKAVSEDPSETISHADDLMVRGSQAIQEGDFVSAVDCLSRAVEIRVTHYGELAPECASAYYKYGCALLYKAQDEADPLVTVPKESNSLEKSEKSVPDGAAETVEIIDGSAATVVSAAKPDSVSSNNEGEMEGEGASDKDQEEDSNGSEGDGEDLAEADEDDSDLDLAWKMLDVARAIVEKNPGDTIEKVDILAALGEVALEREDIETSLSDYLKALSILERLVEPDSRRIAELNFRICLVLEVGSRIEDDAVMYCQKAISTCKARLQRLTEELKNSSGLAATVSDTSPVTDVDEKGKQSPDGPKCDPSLLEKEKEIETLSGLSIELERKLEDLQQAMAEPQSVFSEVFKMVAAKSAADGEKSMSSTEARASSSEKLNSSQMGIMNGGGFDSPTVSTAATNGSVTHLGVVGRGVKRASAIPTSAEPSSKKLLSDSSVDKTESNVSSEVLDSGPQHSETTTM